jgi:cytochrome c6
VRIDRRSIYVLAALVCLFALPFSERGAIGETSGESLFKEHCSPCHPRGGNIVNPKKTLHNRDLEANNIKTAQDIVKKIRNPQPLPTHPQEWAGMRRFDQKTIPDEDALKIADYILKTFK